MQVALSALKELSNVAPFLEITSEQAVMTDKVSQLKLQARDYLGNDISLKTELKSASLVGTSHEEIDVTNETKLSKSDGKIVVDVEAVNSL